MNSKKKTKTKRVEEKLKEGEKIDRDEGKTLSQKKNIKENEYKEKI